MNLYKFHTKPGQLSGYENRLRIPSLAYEYGRRHGFTDELVSAIATDPESAYHYARRVIEDRWPEGEAAIAENPKTAYFYARNVIKGRWPEGEAAIAKDTTYAYEYALSVIKGRWPEGEAAIAKKPTWARAYQERFGIKL